VLPFIFFRTSFLERNKNNLKKSGAALWNFSLSLKALLLPEHLAKLFSLSRRYRFRNMIDEHGHIELPVAICLTGGIEMPPENNSEKIQPVKWIAKILPWHLFLVYVALWAQ
jgi:hypothetical protein